MSLWRVFASQHCFVYYDSMFWKPRSRFKERLLPVHCLHTLVDDSVFLGYRGDVGIRGDAEVAG